MSPNFTCDFCQSCIHVRIHLPSEVDELLGVLYQPLPGSMYNPASKWTEAIIDDRQTALQILFPADHLHFLFNRLNGLFFPAVCLNQLPIKMLATTFLFLLKPNSFVSTRHTTRIAIGDGRS